LYGFSVHKYSLPNCALKDQVVTVPMMTKVAPQAELQQLLLLLPAALGKWTGDLVCIFLVSENASVSLGCDIRICFFPLALLELEVQEHGHVNEVQVALFLPVQNQYSLMWFFQVICTSFQEYVRGYVHLHPRVVFHTYDLTFGDHLTVWYKVEVCHHSVMQNVLIFSPTAQRCPSTTFCRGVHDLHQHGRKHT
jgi:hypothetical protein